MQQRPTTGGTNESAPERVQPAERVKWSKRVRANLSRLGKELRLVRVYAKDSRTWPSATRVSGPLVQVWTRGPG